MLDYELVLEEMLLVRTYIKNRELGSLLVKAIGWFSHRLDKLFYRIFLAFPIRDNMIIFRSTSDFSDNTRAFYDYLIKNNFNKDHKIVWILRNTTPRDYKAPYNVKFVRETAWYPVIRKDFFCAVAKCFIYTHGSGMTSSRPGQTFIHTTHSASQLKSLKDTPERVAPVKHDYQLVCGLDAIKKRKDAFGLSDNQLLIFGMPRLDLLFQDNECLSLLIDEYHGERIILSMETFKQSTRLVDSCANSDIYAINVIHSQEELLSLDAYLEDCGMILIVKIHPYQDMSFLQFVELGNIRFLTNQDLDAKGVQLYELVKNADILLTDYSSIFYDFLLLDRPIGFLLGDMEQYDRGFIDEDPLKDMVGEKLYTLEDLKTFIKEATAGIDRFRDERKQLRDRVFTYQDGNNCKRLLEWMQGNHMIS